MQLNGRIFLTASHSVHISYLSTLRVLLCKFDKILTIEAFMTSVVCHWFFSIQQPIIHPFGLGAENAN